MSRRKSGIVNVRMVITEEKMLSNIDKVQKEVQSAYDDRREELNNIEDSLRRQKDSIDEERNQLTLDRIQYESDKNELANNLLKFNEIVDSFTNGIRSIRFVKAWLSSL